MLDANAIVCAPGYTFDQWKDVSPLVGEWLEAPSRDALTVARYEQAHTAVLVTRLSVLLRETADPAGLVEEWIQAYLNRVRAIAFRTELAREVRAQMVSLFPVRDPDFRYPSSFTRDRQAQLERVLSAAIDAIVGFSWGAPRYLLLLLDRLVQTSLPEALAGDLRHRFMRAVFQHRWTTDPRLLRQGPVGRVQYRVETRELDRALSRFVTNMASTRLAHLDATLGETFVTLWHDMHTDPRPSPEERPLDSVSRLASSSPGGSAAGTTRRSLTAIATSRSPTPFPSTSDGRPRPPPTRWSRTSTRPSCRRSNPDAGPRRRVRHRGRRRRGDELVLNCGLGEPLRMSVDVGYSAEVGDLRAVRLSRAGGAAGWTVQNVLELRPQRQAAGERRMALVRPLPELPWLRVEIDGEDVYPPGGTDDAALIRAAWGSRHLPWIPRSRPAEPGSSRRGHCRPGPLRRGDGRLAACRPRPNSAAGRAGRPGTRGADICRPGPRRTGNRAVAAGYPPRSQLPVHAG